MKKQNLKQKNSEKDEYNEKYSQKKQNQNIFVNFAEYDDQKNELYYEEIFVNSKKKYEIFVEFVEIKIFCIKCKKIFSFRNKLHKHLKKDYQTTKMTKSVREKFVKSITETFIVTHSIIVKFTAFTSNKEYDLTFRKWNYAEIMIKLRSNFDEDFVCLNIETKVFLTNKQFILKRLFEIHIYLMISSLTIKNIESNIHEIKKYVNFSIYLFSKDDSNKMTKIRQEMHLIKSLKANMLIDNDILRSKEIIIDVQEKKTIIRNCQNLIIDVKIHQRESFVRRNVVNQFAIVVSSKSYVKILYKIKNLFSNRDFLFESFSEVSIFIYAHVIDVRITDVIVATNQQNLWKFRRISSSK